MAPRAAVRTLIGSDFEMASYGFTADHLYSSMSADTPPRGYRWGVIKWMDRTRSFATTGAQLMEIWLYQPYDMGRDYGVLDVAVQRAKELLTEAEQLVGGDGWTLTAATWETDSADLTDDAFAALTRFSRFRVAGRPMALP